MRVWVVWVTVLIMQVNCFEKYLLKYSGWESWCTIKKIIKRISEVLLDILLTLFVRLSRKSMWLWLLMRFMRSMNWNGRWRSSRPVYRSIFIFVARRKRTIGFEYQLTAKLSFTMCHQYTWITSSARISSIIWVWQTRRWWVGWFRSSAKLRASQRCRLTFVVRSSITSTMIRGMVITSLWLKISD